jgi:hypothetical protein
MKVTPILFVALFSLAATAGPRDGGTQEKVVAGEVVALSRSTILPNWGPTAQAVTRNVDRKCYPIAAEAIAQLDYFYQILEIAKARVPEDDPIATGQPARKAALKNLGEKVRAMEKTNEGCPDQPLQGGKK